MPLLLFIRTVITDVLPIAFHAVGIAISLFVGYAVYRALRLEITGPSEQRQKLAEQSRVKAH